VPLKLVTRPKLDTVYIGPSYVSFHAQGEAPGALPRGMPAVPSQKPITWLCVVALRQWEQVRSALEQEPDHALTLAGTPVVAEGRCVLLVYTCQAVARAQGVQKQ
jgi:uncharacterized protein YjeT (DUF2065 family)